MSTRNLVNKFEHHPSRQFHRCGVFVVDFEHISYLVLNAAVVNFEHVYTKWDETS